MLQPIRYCRSDSELVRCGKFQSDGSYLSQVYDSGALGTEWNRLQLTGGESCTITVYASDNLTAIENMVLSKPVYQSNAPDILLYGVFGRYIRILITPAAAFSGFEISFPKQSIAELLPAVYQGNEILERFLGVLQSAYMDQNKTLMRFHLRLLPTAQDALPILDNLLGVKDWKADTELLLAAPKLLRRRGTGEALKKLAQQLTGYRAVLVECFQWAMLVKNEHERKALQILYGSETRSAVLLLAPTTKNRDYNRLKELLPDFCPVGVSCRLIRLEYAMLLDGHCYLGVNSRLTEPPCARFGEARVGLIRLE